MQISKLSAVEFHRYFQPPMRKIGLAQRSEKIDLMKCVEIVCKLEKINKPLEEIHIPHMYVDATGSYEHILLSYGVKDTYLVLVTNKDKVLGYHILDMNEKYNS